MRKLNISKSYFTEDGEFLDEQKDAELTSEFGNNNQIIEWIDEFDNKKPVKPIPLVIYRSTIGTNPWILCMGEDNHDREGV